MVRKWRRVCCSGLLFALPVLARSPVVEVAIEASWDEAPLLTQMLQTVAIERPQLLAFLLDAFQVDHSSPFDPSLTDKEAYNKVLAILSQPGVSSEAEIASYKLSLAAREASPAVEASWQYFRSSNLTSGNREGCGSFVEWYGEVACGADELVEVLSRTSSSTGPPSFAFDNVVVRQRSNESATAILYADPYSSNFLSLHSALVKHARAQPIQYKLRWKPPTKPFREGEKLVLSGYGASLDIKKADYLAIDDRPIEESDAASAGAPVETNEYEAVELLPLKATEIFGIGSKAVQHIVASSNPLDTLTSLAQDFPRVAHDLASKWIGNISEDLEAELARNGRNKVSPGMNLLWLNGMQVSEREVDTFSLLRHLRIERRRVQALVDLGLTPRQAVDVLADASTPTASGTGQQQPGQLTAESLGALFDASDRPEEGNVVLWWNDIEKDRRYANWPKSLMDLLRPSYSGQMNQVRRNLFNIVLLLDMSQPASYAFIVEQILPLVSRSMPFRFGLVPLPAEGESTVAVEAVIRSVWHLIDLYGRIDAMQFLAALGARSSPPTLTAVRSTFEASIAAANEAARKEGEVLDFDGVLASSTYGERLAKSATYAKRLGCRAAATGSLGHFFLNGQYSPLDDNFRQNVQQALGAQMQYLQQQIYFRTLKDSDDVSRFFYDLPTTLSRRNAYIFPSEPERPLTIRDDLPTLLDELDSSYLAAGFIRSSPMGLELTASIHLVADLETAEGERFARAALDWLADEEHARLCLVDNPSPTSPKRTTRSPAVKLLEAMHSHRLIMDEDASLAHHVFDGTEEEDVVYENWRRSGNTSGFVRALGLQAGESALVINGRIIASLPDDAFEKDDLAALFGFEQKQRIQPVVDALVATGYEVRDGLQGVYPRLVAAASAIVAAANIPDPAAGMFESTSTARLRDYRSIEGKYSSFLLGDLEQAYFQIGVVLDPVSDTAQKWGPILQALASLPSVHLQVYLNPRIGLRELPIKRFYRHGFRSEVSFDEQGRQTRPTLSFDSLPETALLTLGVDVPNSWLAFPKTTRYDLDNIRLSDLTASARQTGIRAVFELENLIVEGHARDMPAGSPPRGLQLVLSSADEQVKVDSLVMANLGYVQLKANPGVWSLSIRPGRSAEVFEMESVGGQGFASAGIDKTGTTMALTTFEGLTIYPRFRRRTGMEMIDLLDEGQAVAAPKPAGVGLMQRLQSFSRAPKAAVAWKPARAEINIFTVASGLLYERMALIMIVSVLRHTQSSCKFWFIQNFLSPSFKAFMPHMAEAYGFEYEFITFKWPHWLRTQREKQRFIWGYKILFLDVLFPLELDRVIFVDSDQIVRTDLKQLIDLDLQGAPYGYTPMGDDRPDMEGYRFWKTGYWKDHLAGKPYHISALYVIDLDRFRAMGAGDRLRAQYQGLSADPHSLANLDQDLPNNMQHQIPIYSLDKSWLWCETWCAKERLAEAKTIDLCNDVSTGEPKLSRARRILPEWTVYDDEIAALARKVANEAKTAASDAFTQAADEMRQAQEQTRDFVEKGAGEDLAPQPAEVGKAGGHVEGEL